MQGYVIVCHNMTSDRVTVMVCYNVTSDINLDDYVLQCDEWWECATVLPVVLILWWCATLWKRIILRFGVVQYNEMKTNLYIIWYIVLSEWFLCVDEVHIVSQCPCVRVLYYFKWKLQAKYSFGVTVTDRVPAVTVPSSKFPVVFEICRLVFVNAA
jgi:hypothetical protein